MSWGQWAGHIVLATSVLLVLIVLLSFKLWHKARRRRSPLGGRTSPGHLPGQQLLERIRHHDEEVGRATFLAMLALPIMYMVWASFRVPWDRFRWGTSEWVFVVGVLVMFAWGVFDYIRHYKKREQANDGWLAEQVTGQQLNRLVALGCQVLHDLPTEAGNIDHVVIAPRAVYAVETKSFRKPRGVTDDPMHPGHKVIYDGKGLRFPDFATAKPIEQASRQAQWLRRTLRDALGRDVTVVPALALPGWWVDRTEESKRSEVVVFSPMKRGCEFLATHSDRMDDALRRLVAQTLAARYPLIED